VRTYRVDWDGGEVVCIYDVGHLVHVQRLQHLVAAAGSLQCVVLHPTKLGAQRQGTAMQGGVTQDLPFLQLRCKTRAPEGSSWGVLPAPPSSPFFHVELFPFSFLFSSFFFRVETHNGLPAMPRMPSPGNWRSTARMERTAHGNGCYFVQTQMPCNNLHPPLSAPLFDDGNVCGLCVLKLGRKGVHSLRTHALARVTRTTKRLFSMWRGCLKRKPHQSSMCSFVRCFHMNWSCTENRPISRLHLSSDTQVLYSSRAQNYEVAYDQQRA
jgi:hypothetical protein